MVSGIFPKHLTDISKIYPDNGIRIETAKSKRQLAIAFSDPKSNFYINDESLPITMGIGDIYRIFNAQKQSSKRIVIATVTHVGKVNVTTDIDEDR